MQLAQLGQTVRKGINFVRGQRALLTYDVKLAIRDGLDLARKRVQEIGIIQSRVPVRTIRRIIRRRGLALTDEQQLSWWYTIAYERGDTDPLTNYALDFIRDQAPKDAFILVTGCGTGVMLFHLIDAGFTRVDGFDYLKERVVIANDIAKLGHYHCRIWQADGFRPQLESTYGVVLAVHWVYSAWMGNYKNKAIPYEQAKLASKRDELLTDFLSQYAPHINPGGLMIVELTDAVADYRISSVSIRRPIPLDHIYPVRFTPEQVIMCARRNGLEVEDYKFSINGPQPRTCYRLRKPNH